MKETKPEAVRNEKKKWNQILTGIKEWTNTEWSTNTTTKPTKKKILEEQHTIELCMVDVGLMRKNPFAWIKAKYIKVIISEHWTGLQEKMIKQIKKKKNAATATTKWKRQTLEDRSEGTNEKKKW